MVDFTDCKQTNKSYSGANGGKISIIYNNQRYMLKFPGLAKHNDNISYANGCISEYLGSHIFQTIGMEAQDTVLGTYRRNGISKIVVACKDFTSPGIVFEDFGSLKNTVVDSANNGYGTELDSILKAIDEQHVMDPDSLRTRFWNMFIVDTLIGNWDRHNGNWGFLRNEITDMVSLAPVFDCGSSLYPQADEKTMEEVLEDKGLRNHRIFNIPLSAVMLNGRKLNYFDFISSLENEDCNCALKRMVPGIDMEKIFEVIDSTPFITDLMKTFYKTMLKERKKRILDFSLNKLLEKESRQSLS